MLHFIVPYRRTPAVQARLDAQRETVLRSAVDLLAEQGYAGCSMAAVAARAGVATGSVYRHFPNKAALVVELFRLVVSREVAAVRNAADAAGTLGRLGTPGTPGTPGTVDAVSTPGTPGTVDAVSTPGTPGTVDAVSTPGTPGTVDAASTPGTPGTVDAVNTPGTVIIANTATTTGPPDTLLEQIAALVETFARRALKSPRLAYALLAEPVDPEVDAERLVFRRAFRDLFAVRVAAGVAAGVLPPQDAQLTAAAVVGAVAEALVGPLNEGTAEPDIVPALVTVVLRALGGSDAPHP